MTNPNIPTSVSPATIVIAGRYEIVRPLGRGSFGSTFLAHDRTDGREVAIKRLDARGPTDWKVIELFEREATVLRSLRHQGVPAVHELLHDTWESAPATLLVMEYINGVSLEQMIDEKRVLDPGVVLHLLLELVGILEYLHGRVPSILHRDIKPANVIVRSDGLPTLVDFGSARSAYMGPDESGSTIAGTYGYMPYEQYMGQAAPASDLYALAATFLHLITGRPPRAFMTPEGRIEVPESLPGDARVRDVLTRLLRPSPAERFACARDVRVALLAERDTSPSVAVRGHGVAAGVVVAPMTLGPTPRPMDGALRDLHRRLSPGTFELMDSSAKPSDSGTLLDLFWVGLFSTLTVGMLPLAYMSMARARRKRVRRFLINGIPAVGEIISIVPEKLPFDGRAAKVTYRFTADGRLRRDADQILPVLANRWQPGDQVHILYLPDYDYDSVIVSAS